MPSDVDEVLRRYVDTEEEETTMIAMSVKDLQMAA